VRILSLGPHPGIRGPLPKTVPVLDAGAEALGHDVSRACWSRRRDSEGLAAKLFGRTADLAKIVLKVRRERPDTVIVHTTHDAVARQLERRSPIAREATIQGYVALRLHSI
jgi:hypothetical protein